MKKVDPHDVIQKALTKAAASSSVAEARIERLWGSISPATFASNVEALDQLFGVLMLLDQAGCGTPTLNVVKVRQDTDRILTAGQAVCYS